MKISASFLALAFFATVNAQQSAWGQCGGQGWAGPTTCVSGYTCNAQNQYYSQCIPGSASAPAPTSKPPSTIPSSTSTATGGTPTSSGSELPYGTLVTGCTVPNTVAITFDDGPYQWTSALIDSLNAAGVKATFFMCGKLYGCIYDYADVVKKAYNAGHQVASHTWSHQDLTGQSASGLQNEISKVETAFKKILGIKPKWIRPPMGAQNANVLNSLKSLRYKVVTWNLDSQDWNGASVSQSQAKFTSLGNDPRIIPLEHDALQSTAQTLGPWIANWAKQKGLKAVTLSECLGEPVPGGQYEMVGGATPRDSSWVC